MNRLLSQHPDAIYIRKYRETHPRKDKRSKESAKISRDKFRAAHPEEIKTYFREYKGNRYRERVAAKLCMDCPRPATHGIACSYHQQKRRNYHKAGTERIKLEVLTHYGKNGQLLCCWNGCTITDVDMLSIDHVNNDGNIDRKSGWTGSGRRLYAKLKKQNYPDGYQTLCHNHQWKKEILRRKSLTA
jgi:hypothetical protein